MNEHLYVVAYDIGDPKRWRCVFKLMQGYGEWLQLSLFQCRLSAKRHAELIHLLDGLIDNSEDHVMTLDMGPASSVDPKVTSLGKTFKAVAREPVIV